MNLLFIGHGKGSWSIRGEQLGVALGARVTGTPTESDWQWAEVVVLVKRAGHAFAAMAHRRGLPVVWDALDFWRQPTDNARDERAAVELLTSHLADIRPTLTIGATDAMARASRGVYVPHHSWPGLTPSVPRQHVDVVAYEGNPQYLGAWRQALMDTCRRRGWRFDINPSDLGSVDIVVSFRDGIWDGWICRQWKSGVKIVNAIAAGRPVITQASAPFDELGHAGTVIESVDDLDDALDRWTPVSSRRDVFDQSLLRAREFTVAAVADRYRAILANVRDRCAA